MKIIKSLFFLLLIFTLKSIGQNLDTVKTIDYYEFHSAEGPFIFCKINGKAVSRKTYNKVMLADSIYDNLNGLHLVLFKTIKGKLLYSFYSYGADKGEPYGEYKEYYKNGKLKIAGFYKMPNGNKDSGVIDSLWYYYDKKGNLLGTKSYKDGLANGEWLTYNEKGKLLTKKYFLNGFPSGSWTAIKYFDKDSYGTYYFNFYKGFYQGGEYDKTIFASLLDNEENIKSYDYPIQVEKIEYSSQEFYYPKKTSIQNYIVKGKFYEVKDGIIRIYKEFVDGEVVKKIEYDYH